MKIRSGFVSNSSSSSFIIIGKLLSKDEINSKIKEGKELLIEGDYLNEGQDMIDTNDPVMLKMANIKDITYTKFIKKFETKNI